MLAKLFVGPLYILYIGLGLWGFGLVTQYVYEGMGFVGVLLAFFLFPVVYGFAPLWAGFADGYWLPAMVCYAPLVLMMVVGAVGSALEGRG